MENQDLIIEAIREKEMLRIDYNKDEVLIAPIGIGLIDKKSFLLGIYLTSVHLPMPITGTAKDLRLFEVDDIKKVSRGNGKFSTEIKTPLIRQHFDSLIEFYDSDVLES